MRFESILEELSELPSPDATIQMEDHDKRVMPGFIADDTNELRKKAFSVGIEYSPPPPPLQCMATASISASLQTNVAFFCNSPVASSYAVRSPMKTNVVDTNALFLAMKDKMNLLHGKRSRC
ncbi:hypothetical protein EG68_10654 [Paragonimus skrjabini miyazakii]|uniref:Uncharacterized protein n=1 Tax=Paragonimus skrjabini miyazakii TaxID=59628 RepID=A0A8S9YFU3_9TREM|nr:hypothetical protein EG68_10654 [Paragonimus skrjabini miyazakii]